MSNIGQVRMWGRGVRPGSRGTNLLPGFVNELAKAITADSLFPRTIRITPENIFFGEHALDNKELAVATRALGVAGFTVLTGQQSEAIGTALEKVFSAVLIGHKEGLDVALADTRFFKDVRTCEIAEVEKDPLAAKNERSDKLLARLGKIVASRKEYVRWPVYCGTEEETWAKGLARISKQGVVRVYGSRADRVEAFCDRIENKKIGLFTLKPINQYAEGYFLRRVVCAVVDGRRIPFPSSVQCDIAEKLFGVTVERNLHAKPRTYTMVSIETQAQLDDLEQRLLQRVKREYFDGKTGELKSDLKRRILVNVREKNPTQLKQYQAAMEELEELLREI